MERVKLKISTPKPPAPTPKPARLDVFGPPPLLVGEDPAAYDELLLRVSTAVKPVDFLEEIWVRDVVDLTWEIFRLRRLKAGFISEAADKILYIVLRPLLA